MASSSQTQNGGPDHIIRSRPVNKASNPVVLRAQSEERSLKPNGHIDTIMSGVSRYVGHQYWTEEIMLNYQQWPLDSDTR